MSTIDERIVSMKFNGAQFMAGIRQASGVLDTLKKSLNLDGAGKGLDEVGAKANGINLGGLTSGLSTVNAGFVALATVGISALSNITNKAVDAGLAMAKSLTVDPIMAGFGEYELKMGSIQTILSNTARHGTGLEEVTANLDALNEYADKTIYNFGDMTKNIGLFTNAGIKVGEATSMIKGFSNEAAASGTSSQGAAGAAYQLSQALSAGKVTLMDWRSLQNVGMGNKNMQLGILEIADAMGTLEEKGLDSATVQSDFNGSLEKGWLTADVMSNYLKIMAGDMDEATQKSLGLSDATIATFKTQQQNAEEAATKVRTWTQLVGTMQESVGSSWAETFDILIGDFDKATELWTNVNNALGPMLGASGEARNALLKSWSDLGGRDDVIDGLKSGFQALMGVITPITEAFKEIFPPMTAQQLKDITQGFQDFMATLVPGEAAMENIKRAAKGFFAVLDIAWTIVSGLIGVIAGLFGVVGSGSGSFLEIAAAIGDFLVGVRDAIKSGDVLSNIFKILGAVIQVPLGLLGLFVSAIAGLFTGVQNLDASGLEGIFSGIGERLGRFADLGSKASEVWGGVKSFFSDLGAWMAPGLAAVGDALGGIGTWIGQALADTDWGLALDAVSVGLLGGLVLVIKNFLSGGTLGDIFGNLKETLFGDGPSLVDTIKETFGAVTETFTAMQSQLKADTLLKIAGAIALLTISVVALSMIDSAKLTSALTGMTVMFGQLIGALYLLDVLVNPATMGKLPVLAGALILMAIAMAIFAGAIKSLSELSWSELAVGLAGTAGGLLILIGASALLSKQSGNMILAGLGLAAIALAVKVLASALRDMSGFSWEELGTGLVAMGVSLGIVAGFSRLVNPLQIAAAALSLVLIGGALKIVASDIGDLGSMDGDQLVTGLVGVAGALAIIAGAMALMPGPTMILTGAGLVIVAAALNLMVGPLQDLGSMSWDEIGRSLVMLAGSLAILAGAMYLMTGAIVGAASLVVVAGALFILVPALKELGTMSWDEIGRGLVMLAGSLAILAGGLYLMTAALPGAAALVIASAALMILAPVMETMGNMEWDEIGRGLTLLAGTLGILAIGLTLMVAALPGALALVVVAAGLTVLVPVLQALGAMTWDQIGMGLGVLAAALLVLSVAGVALLPAIPGLMGLGAAMVLIGIAALAAGIGISLLAVGLTTLATAGTAVATVIGGFLQSLITVIPQIFVAIGEGIIAMAAVITEGAPAIGEAFGAILQTMIDMVIQYSPQIINMITTLISDLLDAIVVMVPEFTNAGMEILIGFLDGIANNLPAVIQKAGDVVVAFIDGIGNQIPRIVQAGIQLVIDFVNGVAEGIRNNTEAMNQAGRNLADAIVDGMVAGIGNGIGIVIDAANQLAQSALNAAMSALGINSPSKEFAEIGMYSSEGLSVGLVKNSWRAERGAETVADRTLSVMKGAMAGAFKTVTKDVDMQPTITPVMDLSQVKGEASKLGNMVNPSSTINASVSAQKTDAAALGFKNTRVDGPFGDGSLDGQGGAKEGVNVTYNQYNNSPTALEPIEIYRNTKNSLSTLKTVIDYQPQPRFPGTGGFSTKKSSGWSGSGV